MKKEPGFTTVELMIVVCVMGVVAAIGALSYLSMRPTLRLSGSAQQIIGDLMAARMKAVNENNNYKVFFLNSQEYKILDDDDGNGAEDAGEWSETKNIQDNYPGVTITASAEPSFSARGTASALTSITVSNTSGTTNISVRATGQVKAN